MNFLRRLVSIINKDKKEEEIKWNIEYKKNYILMKSNIDLNLNNEINDLIIMYEMNLEDNNIIKITYDEIYDLYYDEYGYDLDIYKLFNLPNIFRGNFKIMNKGNFIVDKEVSYTYKFIENGDSYNIEEGNILKCSFNNEYRIMSKELYNLVKKVKEYNFNNIKKGDEASQYEMLKLIKDSSKKINISLNERLNKEEEPIIVDKIVIDFEDDGKTLELYPKLIEDNETNNKILNKINTQGIRGSYFVNTSQGKKRYVIKNKDTLEKIINNRINTGKKRLDILSGKSEIYNDENIDLSLFGPRVIGIGVLNYKSSFSKVETKDLDWLDKEVEFPYMFGSNIEGEYKKIDLKPKDSDKLKSALLEMENNDLDKIELEFENNDGSMNKIIMTKDNIKDEINNIDLRIKSIYDIKKKKDIKALLDLCEKNEEDGFIHYNGLFIRSFDKIKEELQRKLDEKDIREKQKRKSLLIADNIDSEDYNESEGNVKIKSNKELELPLGLKDKIELFDYQKECLLKLQRLYCLSKQNGFLLCDDMGLGKTLQLLSFLSWLKDKDELKPSLIVAPTSLLNNWDSKSNGEIQKFFKENYFLTDRVVGRINEDSLEELRNNDIVFTTYESLRINNVLLGKINWKVMICDEAQKIKTPTTMVTIAAKAQNANFKIICSATPIENSLIDLWTLADFSKPGLLASLSDFKKQYMKRQDIECVNDELYNKIKDYYIRREKDILPNALPKKCIKIYNVKPLQKEINTIESIKSTEQYTITAIQKMIAVCSYSDMFTNKELTIESSSKIKILKNILEEIKSKDEKVIIFTKFKKAQKVVHMAIKQWFGLETFIVNGEETNLNNRTKKITQFRNSIGFNVIILSPEVAGFGITITEANHVIHYSRLWNPAKEDQSTDRIYRIGQKKTVTVYYPMISFEKEGIVQYDNVQDYINDNKYIKNKLLSPEEKLNILLARKKDMLLNFFLAGGSCDISVSEFMDLDKSNMEEKNITIEDINNGILTPDEFEELIAVLYKKKGYATYLSVISNRKPIDIIGINKNEILFIKCIFTNNIEKSVIDNIMYEKNEYFKFVKEKMCRVILIVNGNNVNKNYNNNNIEIVDKEKLNLELQEHKIFKSMRNNEERYSYGQIVECLKNFI